MILAQNLNSNFVEGMYLIKYEYLQPEPKILYLHRAIYIPVPKLKEPMNKFVCNTLDYLVRLKISISQSRTARHSLWAVSTLML